MAPTAIAARPVRTLHELFAALEAAIAVTLADPKPKAVHRLRTTTRRIEAQLELLSLLPDLPEHAKPKTKVRKLLRKLRRAAGRVRDLDVQSKLTQSRSFKLHPEADRLHGVFMRRRDAAAERLLHTLYKHQDKLTRLFRILLETLAPAETLLLSGFRLAQLTLRWYADNIPATANGTGQLHTIRKAAKLARYMAESGTPAKSGAFRTPVTHLARTFESLQQSGGVWHDWLTLSSIARRELGASSRLRRSFASKCEESLANYRAHLKLLQETLKPRHLDLSYAVSSRSGAERPLYSAFILAVACSSIIASQAFRLLLILRYNRPGLSSF